MSDQPEGLFTQEQEDYVDSVAEKLLRPVLLHNVRLCDLIEADRNSLEKRCEELTEQVIELKALLAKQEN